MRMSLGIDSKHISLKRVPLVDPNSVDIFNLGENDMMFCRRNASRGLVTFTTHNQKEMSVYEETQLSIDGTIKIVEVYESVAEVIDDPMLRVVGIRDSEEVLVWEVRQKRAKEMLVTNKIFNRVDRSCLRWPFYAYASSEKEIVVTNMAKSNVGISIMMGFDAPENSYIHKLCFSNGCDLYILCHEHNNERHNRKVVIYKVDVGSDTTIEKSLNVSRTSTLPRLPGVMRV